MNEIGYRTCISDLRGHARARTAGHYRRVDVGAARREAARHRRARWRQADRVALAETRRRQIALDSVLLHRFITGSNMQG